MGVCVLGSINLDVVCRVAELPAPGETLSALGVGRFPGGKGLNQAVAAARWGASTTMIGAVGDDGAGAELCEVLRAAGVDTTHVAELSGVPTGHGYIHVSAAGENMIVVAGGANLELTESAATGPRLDPSATLLAQLETPQAAVRAFLNRADRRSGLKLLNAAPATVGGEALLPLADVVIVNETELARYSGAAMAPVLIDEVVPLARRLVSRPGQRVVVTLGAAGAVAITGDGVLVAPGRRAHAVDTTGAGDCFCGVLAAMLDAGAPIAEAMEHANAAAALSTQTHGAAVSMPTRAATAAFAAGRRERSGR